MPQVGFFAVFRSDPACAQWVARIPQRCLMFHVEKTWPSSNQFPFVVFSYTYIQVMCITKVRPRLAYHHPQKETHPFIAYAHICTYVKYLCTHKFVAARTTTLIPTHGQVCVTIPNTPPLVPALPRAETSTDSDLLFSRGMGKVHICYELRVMEQSEEKSCMSRIYFSKGNSQALLLSNAPQTYTSVLAYQYVTVVLGL